MLFTRRMEDTRLAFQVFPWPVRMATPRERIVLDPGEDCPDCGGALRLLGEDVSEILELITAKLKVIH